MADIIKELSSNKCFGGYQKVFTHESKELKCTMRFGIYLPPAAEAGRVPVLYWLSGLTCTEQNFITKAGAQKYASEYGLIIVAPDTSPLYCQLHICTKVIRQYLDQFRFRRVDCNSSKHSVPVGHHVADLVSCVVLKPCVTVNVVLRCGTVKTFTMPKYPPSDCGIEGERDSYDFGCGAGFYVDATQDKWKRNYRMFSYITRELPALINANFPTQSDRQSIFGHSMGGHGALVCALRNPGFYRSVSAFAPICNPMNCPWGQKAFAGYLGPDTLSWQDYDAICLLHKYNGPSLELLVDQGKADNFLADKQLLPEKLMEACTTTKTPIVMRMQEGYDHSYFFIATFIEDHIRHHAKFLKA